MGLDQASPIEHIRGVLERNELTLYCQPIRSLAGGGDYPMAEVLVRMLEEEHSMLPPGDFIPIFEHYRMMPAMDRWVVAAAVRRLAQGSKIPRFSINLSGQTLEDPDFPGFVATELMRARVRGPGLLFELHMRDVVTLAAACESFAASIKTIGCGLVIDALGAQAVSAAPMKILKPDFIKLDGALTRKIVSDETAVSRLKGILAVCESLGIKAIAESVEEQDVLLRLKAFGVEFAQGFGIYRPHPIDHLAGPSSAG
jgi:EAL domain-containing protein (putative c-di-GMP-specific phosphodiesterase class I)